MPRLPGKPMVKKSVVLRPVVDEYIRKTWAMLIDQGYEANYSTTLNYILLTAIMAGARKGDFSQEAREALQSFLAGQDVPQDLTLHEGLANLQELLGVGRLG